MVFKNFTAIFRRSLHFCVLLRLKKCSHRKLKYVSSCTASMLFFVTSVRDGKVLFNVQGRVSELHSGKLRHDLKESTKLYV